MKRWTLGIAALVVLIAVGTTFGGLVVTQTGDADTLANTIVGTGITVVGSPTYTGAAVASGTFTGGLSAGIGINDGIILTSGNASLAPGPNIDDFATGDNGLPGDSDLDAIVSPDVTYDATLLEFDFQTAGGDLYFDYVFASEEYNEYVFQFNDVFTFLLDGTNIALVPGTTTAVSIDTVNNGVNSAFYNDNDPSDLGIPTPYDVEYDGFTDVFTATALGVGAGTHHIKLAIADTGDRRLDSAVFVRAGTFSDEPPPPLGRIPEPAAIAIWALLGLSWVTFGAWRRRGKGSIIEPGEVGLPGRRPWSEENRIAIRQMLERHLAE